MEGDSEGLVAIVQGLEYSGVTLTVCRPRQNADRSRLSGAGHRIPDQRINMIAAVAAAAPPAQSTSPAVQSSLVETSTGTDFSRISTASQICDGRYASSYKMAHCMVNPTSPPEMVTEFPPQRKEPCRNQGNFEIGGQGSPWSCHNAGSHGAVPARLSTSKVRHYGGTDKGSSHRYSKLNHREMEAFAHSLRKYPSMAPFRTASTDLIEKLIRYTQPKNYQEMSRSTKSMRSLQQQKPSETNETVRVSKHQQTYTRRQDENVTTNSHVQVGHRGRTKNFKLYSPMGDNRNLRENRCRGTTFSSSYNYLKAGNPSYGRSNRFDGSPSPTYSRSPERRRSPEEFRSPDSSRSPEGSRVIRADRSSRSDRPHPLERTVRDLSLSEMARYIRNTIRQIHNERPVVVQVCPKLKQRFNQHKKVCPNKNERSIDVMKFEEEEEDPEVQDIHQEGERTSLLRSTMVKEQAGCQCTRTDCYCSKATQCVNNPEVTTRTVACGCTTANTVCCRGMSCVCAHKSQDQAYHKKRIDEEISEWLKDVPVTGIEDAESKKRRETIIKELRKTLKQLSDDENFEENAAKEIQGFVDDVPVWNPGKDENDEKLFKNQLADKLTEKIIAIPRKPHRFRDIVRKWVANLNFEEDDEEIDMEAITDNFVNKLMSLAADRPACDVKYTNILRKEIMELLVEFDLKFDGDMIMLKKMANNLAKEMVSVPKNVKVSGETDLSSEFEDSIADWICEHGLCKELKRDPKLIQGLAKKLNKIKSQGIYDDDVLEKMKEEVQQSLDDVGLSFETIDELIEELMNQLSVPIQIEEKERLDQVELIEEVSNWLCSLVGDDLHSRKLELITEDLVKMIQDSNEQENENLANDIVDYLVDTELSIDSADLSIYVEELMEKLNILSSNKFYKEQVKRIMLKDIFKIIEGSPMPEDKKEKMKSKANQIVELNLGKSSLNLLYAPDNVKEILLQDMDNAVSDIDMHEKIRSNFDKYFTRLKREQSDLKQTIDPRVKEDMKKEIKAIFLETLYNPLSDNVQHKIEEDIFNVIDEMDIPEFDKKNLNSNISHAVAKATNKLISQDQEKPQIKNILEKVATNEIKKSAISKDKKEVLENKIKDLLTENLVRPVTDDVKKMIKERLEHVVDDLISDKSKADAIKSRLITVINKDITKLAQPRRRLKSDESLQDQKQTMDLKEIENIVLEMERAIDEAPIIIPGEKKNELKRKLKNIAIKNIEKPLQDVAERLKDDINVMFNELNLPKDKKSKLKIVLLTAVDEYMSNLQTARGDQHTEYPIKKQLLNEKRTYSKIGKSADKPLHIIMQDIDRAIEESSTPRRIKKELKKKLQNLATKDFKRMTPEDVAEALEDDLIEIIDELNLPKDKKNKLKSTLSTAVDEYMSNLQTAREDKDTEYPAKKRRSNEDSTYKKIGVGLKLIEEVDASKVKDSILKGIKNIVDKSTVSEEKKMDLKRKLTNVVAENMKKPFSEDLSEATKKGIEEILGDLPIPNSEKNKLKSELTSMVNKNVNNLRRKPRDQIDLSDELQEEAPRDKAIETKKLKDEMKVKYSCFQGIEKVIDKSAVPEGKKTELKRKLKTIAAESLKKPFSQNVQDTVKTGIADIIDDLPVPISEKIKLTSKLTSIVEENVDNLRGEARDQASSLRKSVDKPLHNIMQDIDRAIEEASIPRGKKKELKKNLQNLATRDFKRMTPEDVAEALEDDLIEIIDELNLPKEKKNKLKSALSTAVGEYMSNLQTAREDKDTEYPAKRRRSNEDSTYEKNGIGLKPIEEVDASKVKDSILRGIKKIIDKSTIPEEKKTDLKKKLTNLVAENLKKPFSEDLSEATKKGIEEILGDLPISNSEKNKLKSELTSMANENLDKLVSKHRHQIDHLKELEERNILKGFQKVIDEAPILKEKKFLLKKEMAKIIDNEESLDDGESDDVSEAFALQESSTPDEYREKIIGCIKTWLDNLPKDFDPEVVTAVAENLASEILDRQKYLQAHPEIISADDSDEIENLKYQVFRRMNNVVDPKNMPLVMERTEELYRSIAPPEGVPNLGSKG